MTCRNKRWHDEASDPTRGIIGGALHAMQTLAIEGHHGKRLVTEESARLISKLVSEA